MVYDTVILTKAMEVEMQYGREQKMDGSILYFNPLDDYKSLLDQIKQEHTIKLEANRERTQKTREQNGKLPFMAGILLEIVKVGELLTLQVLCAVDKVEQIHSKKIILESYDMDTSHNKVSMYELLWAAGVKIDSQTLRPILSKDNETSMEGLYYYG